MDGMLPAPPAVLLELDLALDELLILPAPVVHPFAFLAGKLDELILGHSCTLKNMRQRRKNQEKSLWCAGRPARQQAGIWSQVTNASGESRTHGAQWTAVLQTVPAPYGTTDAIYLKAFFVFLVFWFYFFKKPFHIFFSGNIHFVATYA